MTYQEAEKQGWVPKQGNLGTVLPGKMVTRGIYLNRNKKLPDFPGCAWHEADINYESGYRGRERVVWSDAGVVFVTYDHYETFIEITREG